MRTVSAVVLCMVVWACASSPDGTQARDLQNVITREQIADSNETTLFGVVDRYHPEWLQVTNPHGLLIVDDDLERLGAGSVAGLDVLRMKGTEGVYALEYLNNIRARSLIRNMAGARTAIILRARSGGGG